MGIRYEIGEAKIEWDADCVRISAKHARSEMLGANSHGMSYSFSDKFEKALKAESLFGYVSYPEFDKAEPLITEYQGAMPIVEAHYEYLKAKVDAYKCGPSPDKEILDLADWMLWWIRASLDNCQQPVFVNR